ncbi:capsule biosynthesis GfcC family protein [Halomonas piscis]|uniref:Capsule biosynthesis GfcC family protein n=1 Tax=Halomonas piscis TaxID=3031727 RepID=A0ABY9Z1E6_9GAMM|nr:capsule biosynthesis GfcC family protein [Halomonas piscis]WNK20104.1 capsule biosynthesis GfcC family protein [Halomonas piscis]
MTAAQQALKTLAMALALAIAPMAVPLAAQGQDEPRLSDGWLSRLADAPPVAWSHAFALRERTAAPLDQKRRRLVAELETLMIRARLGSGAGRIKGLAAWQQRLKEEDALPARTPGRHDLPWLGAHLRQDPPLAKVALWGSCEPPAWVEIWHLNGITRLPWRQAQSLGAALEKLERQNGARARAGSDYAWLITPTGALHRRGIAAWNAQATPLAPGSRVVLTLPRSQGPVPGAGMAEALVNARLPAYLATRLPGDDCTLWTDSDDDTTPRHRE